MARRFRRLLPITTIFAASGCAASATETKATSSETKPGSIVVLVAIDGVRARDVFEGAERARWGEGTPPSLRHLPSLENHEGTVGPPRVAFRASGPNFVSLPGYIEMLGGRASSVCRDNECAATTDATLLDEFAVREGTDEKAAAIASWDRIERAASANQRGFVSTGNRAGHHHERLARHPSVANLLSAGERQRGPGGIRKDEATASLALEYLREVRPTFLFVGLGETDEFAHAGDYRSYYRALESADRTIGRLLGELEKLRSKGYETTLLVTTDHGRAENFRDHGAAFPESSESFLLSFGAHSTLERTRPARLSDIAEVVRHRVSHSPALVP